MDYIRGADISIVHELEKLGARYYDGEGQEKDIFSIMKESGVNMIRLKIWNDPYSPEGKPYGGGTNDWETTKELAKRVKENDMELLLNFHYSDFWADPKKQCKPKAWEGLSLEGLAKKVHSYTTGILKGLKDEGVVPSIVQVGNEVTNGLLWPEGQILDKKQENYNRMFKLLSSGIRAVREFDPHIRVMLHLDFGGDNELYRSWFDEAVKRETDFDIIGLSYYPFWHRTLDDLEYNMNDIAKRYDKDLIVVETAYGFTLEEYDYGDAEESPVIFNEELAKEGGYPATPEGQRDFLAELNRRIQRTVGGRGRGFFYWAPELIPVEGSTWGEEAGRVYAHDEAPGGNSWANLALFDYEGRALPGLTEYKNY